MFNIVNRTIVPNNISDIVVQGDNDSRNIKYKIQRNFEITDLSTKSISIRYTTPDGKSDESFARNLISEMEFITFEWNISAGITIESGIVTYDILFYNNDGYKWHTKPATLNIEKGLKVTTIKPQPTTDWIDSWRAEAGTILTQCRESESKAIQVEGNISVAIDAATRATSAATKIESNIDKTLTKDNAIPYSPTADYHPATKKYIDEKAISVGAGDMLKVIYDTNNDGVVDNSEKLDGKSSYEFEPSFIKKDAFNKDFGNVLGTVCEGSDPRLSDVREASGGRADNVPWGGVENTPTTVAGYHITDAATKSEIPTAVSQLTNDSGFATNDQVNIMQTEVTGNTTARHSHSNKGILDGITSTLVTAWNSAVTHITDVVKHITAAERTLWNTVSSKADAEEVKTLKDTKAPLASPAFTGGATIGGKKIPTMESGTCELSLGGSLTNGSFVYSMRTGEYTRIGNYIDIRGSITISEVISVPTGEVIIYGLPGVPKDIGMFSINYLNGGKNESMRNCYFGHLGSGRVYLKVLTTHAGNPLTAGILSTTQWGGNVGVEKGKQTITVLFMARYFTD